MVESQTQFYERLIVVGILHPIKEKPVNPLNKWYRDDERYAYPSGMVEHDIERYIKDVTSKVVYFFPL